MRGYFLKTSEVFTCEGDKIVQTNIRAGFPTMRLFPEIPQPILSQVFAVIERFKYDDGSEDYARLCISSNVASKPGDCGTPNLIFFNGQWRIFGLTHGNYTKHTVSHGSAMFVPREDLDENELPIAVEPFSAEGTKCVAVAKLAKHFKPVFSQPPKGNFAAVGTVSGRPHATNCRTQLKPTPIKDFYLPCAVEPSRTSFSGIYTMEEKYGIDRVQIAPSKRAFATECLRHLFVKTTRIPKRPYTWDEIASLIAKDKSVGYGWDCKRKELVYEDESGWHLHSTLIDAVVAIEAEVTAGRILTTVITPSPKDEIFKFLRYIG